MPALGKVKKTGGRVTVMPVIVVAAVAPTVVVKVQKAAAVEVVAVAVIVKVRTVMPHLMRRERSSSA
jgi:hypothetical protein